MDNSQTAASAAFGAMYANEVRKLLSRDMPEDRAFNHPEPYRLAVKAAKQANIRWIEAQKELFGVGKK